MSAFLTADGKRAISEAVAAVESETSAELVVAVRARSVDPTAARLAAGASAFVLALAFVLFSPIAFSTPAIFFDPLVVALVVFVLAGQVPAIERAFTHPAAAAAAVEQAARAAFVDKGVSQTRDRSGILLFISQLERRAVVVADCGIEGAADPEAWDALVQTIAADVRRGASALALAKQIRAFGPLLRAGLPRRDDDIDELDNTVREG